MRPVHDTVAVAHLRSVVANSAARHRHSRRRLLPRLPLEEPGALRGAADEAVDERDGRDGARAAAAERARGRAADDGFDPRREGPVAGFCFLCPSSCSCVVSRFFNGGGGRRQPQRHVVREPRGVQRRDALVVAAALDILLTWLIVGPTMGGIELNPIAARLLDSGGITAATYFKFATVMVVMFLSEFIGRRNGNMGRMVLRTAVVCNVAVVMISSFQIAMFSGSVI